MSTDVVVIDPPPNAPIVVVAPASPDVVLIAPPGPPGLPGGGLAAQAYVLSSVSSWTRAHAYPYPPLVHFVDDAGLSVLCTVSYVDSTHIHISFPTPFTGTVVLS